MRHCREDYEAIQPFPTRRPHYVKIDGETVLAGDEHLGKHMDPIIPDDEPVFLLRAKDRNAPFLVRQWARELRVEAEGMPEGRARSEAFDLADRVDAWAAHMVAYAFEHYDGGKVPDTPAELLKPPG